MHMKCSKISPWLVPELTGAQWVEPLPQAGYKYYPFEISRCLHCSIPCPSSSSPVLSNPAASHQTPDGRRPRPPRCSPANGCGDIRGSEDTKSQSKLDTIELMLPPPSQLTADECGSSFQTRWQKGQGLLPLSDDRIYSATFSCS